MVAITPDLCTDFVEAWQDDVVAWQKICNGTNTVGGPRDAMDVIGATRWRVAEFGDPEVASTHRQVLLTGARAGV
jgi:hypothetical protein